MGAPAHRNSDSKWAALLPFAVLLLASLAAYLVGAEMAVLAGGVAAFAAAWGVGRRLITRLVLALALAPLPVAALLAHRLEVTDTLERALDRERAADQLLFVAGDPARAIPLLEEAVRLEPSFFALHKLGTARLQAGDPLGASEAFASALQSPDGPEDTASYERAIAWLRDGRLELATAALQVCAREAQPFDGLR